MKRDKRRALRQRGGRELLFAVPIVLTVLVLLSLLLVPNFLLPSASEEPRRARSSVDAKRLKLLLSTHNRFFWYYPDTKEEVTLHQGEGVYYGAFPGDRIGDTQSVWVVSRPHNWHASSTKEWLLQLDMETGAELSRVQLPSRFTHDAIRTERAVWVCNTGEGQLLQYSWPGMQLDRTLQLFTLREHVNTLAALDDSSIWAVLHNLGESMVARVDLKSGEVTQRLDGVGRMAHGLVAWRGLLVMLDSDHAQLVTVDPNTEERQVIWKGESGQFLKGLTVVDDVAYFGVAPTMRRQDRAIASYSSALAAVHLLDRTLLFKRPLDTRGLLNVVSAPHLAVSSTYRAVSTAKHPDHEGVQVDAASGLGAEASGSWTEGRVGSAPVRNAVAADDMVGGLWPTGLPHLKLDKKGGVESGISDRLAAARTKLRLGSAPAELLEPLQAAINDMPAEWWEPHTQATVNAVISDREVNLQYVKPGVDGIQLVFSTQSAKRVWQLPLYEYFKPTVEPLLQHIIGQAALHNIVRLQLARMRPGSHITPHADHGGWTQMAHRIHVVTATNADVSFRVCSRCDLRTKSRQEVSHYRHTSPDCQPDNPKGSCTNVEVAEGDIFEIDNLITHAVTNNGSTHRTHLILDVAEATLPPRVLLKPGQSCHYRSANMGRYEPGC